MAAALNGQLHRRRGLQWREIRSPQFGARTSAAGM